MRIGTFFFCLREGLKNTVRNIWYTLASIAIVGTCIFLLCLFFCTAANLRYIVHNAEETVGITVFFDDGMTEEQIMAVGDQIRERPEVRQTIYISASEAWENFKSEYFGTEERLAEGFQEDNPLANSASYEIYLKNIEDQPKMVNWLQSMEGVRRVNYSNEAVAGLSRVNRAIAIVSMAFIGILLLVAVFLISNTITTAAAFRADEYRIERLIGATNFMIRAPFVFQGLLLGFIGSVIPLGIIYVLYQKATAYFAERFGVFSDVIRFLPIEMIFPMMAAAGLLLGVGIGFVGSFFTIRKHMKV